jgi:heme-degrading monooxygenase HmoA
MRPTLKFAPALPFDDRPSVILINIYKAQPGRQDEVLKLLETATRDVMRHLRGFVSCAFHKGVDGRSVALYAEWESAEAWRAMSTDDRMRTAMMPVFAISTCQPLLFDASSPIWPPLAAVKTRESA